MHKKRHIFEIDLKPPFVPPAHPPLLPPIQVRFAENTSLAVPVSFDEQHPEFWPNWEEEHDGYPDSYYWWGYTFEEIWQAILAHLFLRYGAEPGRHVLVYWEPVGLVDVDLGLFRQQLGLKVPIGGVLASSVSSSTRVSSSTLPISSVAGSTPPTSSQPAEKFEVYLTFDDGPRSAGYGTDHVLEQLAAKRVVATFFVNYTNALAYLQEDKKTWKVSQGCRKFVEMILATHLLANHGYTHYLSSSDPLARDRERIVDNMTKNVAEYRKEFGNRADMKFARLPGSNTWQYREGKPPEIDSSQRGEKWEGVKSAVGDLKNRGYILYGWDHEWQSEWLYRQDRNLKLPSEEAEVRRAKFTLHDTPEEMADKVLEMLRAGALGFPPPKGTHEPNKLILLMHDAQHSRRFSENKITQLIDNLNRKSPTITFKTLVSY